MFSSDITPVEWNLVCNRIRRSVDCLPYIVEVNELPYNCGPDFWYAQCVVYNLDTCKYLCTAEVRVNLECHAWSRCMSLEFTDILELC